MPVRGARLKPPGQAVTRHRPIHDWFEIPDVPFAGGPRLPRTRVNGQPWMRRTKEKWLAWSSMPHCKLWGRAEWDFALDSIEIAAQLHSGGDARCATELRAREKVLGTTWDFRRDLRIRYVEPGPVGTSDEDASVTQLADYREG